MSSHRGIATIRLHPWHRGLVYLALIVIAGSGIAWTVLEDWLMQGPGPLPQLLLKTHGIFSFLTLMAVGSLLPTHMRLAWRQRRNVLTGVVSALVLLVLIVTAMGLYYGGEDWRELTKWTHVVVGVAVVLVLPVHVLLGRRTRYRQMARSSAG